MVALVRWQQGFDADSEVKQLREQAQNARNRFSSAAENIANDALMALYKKYKHIVTRNG